MSSELDSGAGDKHSLSDSSTKPVYDEQYFQGHGVKSNYNNYLEEARGPSEMLGETLHSFFRPVSALDVGCAVGHSVKRLRELGTEAYGVDISEWAVSQAAVPYIREFDLCRDTFNRQFELVYSYDVLEHLPMNRLEFAARNLWKICRRDLLIVPATYEHGEQSDPNEPTHLIFQSRQWWLNFFVQIIGARFDEKATNRFREEEHSRIFNYSDRVMIFTRLEVPNSVVTFG